MPQSSRHALAYVFRLRALRFFRGIRALEAEVVASQSEEDQLTNRFT
jgi:hypothetical protein